MSALLLQQARQATVIHILSMLASSPSLHRFMDRRALLKARRVPVLAGEHSCTCFTWWVIVGAFFCSDCAAGDDQNARRAGRGFGAARTGT
jgi:hypothetical protein